MKTATAKYFQGCSTVAEIKALYKQLAIKNHPDRGGDTATMQEINNQYEAALKSCNGQTVTGSDGKEHTYKWDEETERKLMVVIDKLLTLQMENVDIALIGVWIWITGDTKPYKEQLKEMGCRWHAQRGCWYFKPYEAKHWGSNASLEDLAKTYGSTDVENLRKKERKAGKKGIKSA
jgi:hypothetical protein